MKLTEKDLRKLIKEELEGSEDTRDAIESNLHDEIIVRYFEANDKEGESGQQAYAGSVESGKELRSGAGITAQERTMISNLRNLLVAAAKKQNITSGGITRYIKMLGDVLQKNIAKASAGAESPPPDTAKQRAAEEAEARAQIDNPEEQARIGKDMADSTKKAKEASNARRAKYVAARKAGHAPDVSANMTEEIINKVVENLFDSNQNK